MDLNHPIPVHGVDEIARLGRSVNTMLTAIDTARRAQRTLVEDAGHELRTPLTSIRTNIELLLAVERQPELAHRLPPEDRAKLLRDLDAQVGELATLTTELVELAREETTREDDRAGRPDRRRHRRDRPGPHPRARPHLRHRPATGDRAGPARRAGTDGRQRARQRRQVEPPGATVHTALRADGTGLVPADASPTPDPASTKPTGPTSSTASTGPRRARALPGSGLGLAIVAQTATQHGGTVTAEPIAPHGTVITIRLPCAPAPVPAVPAG